MQALMFSRYPLGRRHRALCLALGWACAGLLWAGGSGELLAADPLYLEEETQAERATPEGFDFAPLEQIRVDANVAAMAVVLVERNGPVQSHVSGVRDWMGAQPVDQESIFRIGSVSKLFTGLTLLKAEEKGLLRLNQSVAEILSLNAQPGAHHKLYDNPWEDKWPLRLAQLMEHTAGWYDMSGLEFDHSDPKPLSLKEALAIAPASRRSHWPPGMHSEYSNSGAGLAAYVLEQAAGEDFETLARRWLFEPLRMDSADYQLSPQVQNHLVQGYDHDGRKPIPYWHIIYRPAAGLNLVPRQMSALLQMLLARGQWRGQRLFSEAQIHRLEHPETTLAASVGLEFGYGLGIYQTQHQGHSLFVHGGDADGYLSHLAYSPSSGRAYFVVITAFNHRPLARLKEALNDWVIAAEARPAKPEVFPLSEEIRRLYVGQYRAASQRFPGARGAEWLRVLDRNGQLFTQIGDDSPRPLIAVSQRHFRRPWETTATAAFIPLADGGMVLQGGMGNWQRTGPLDGASSH